MKLKILTISAILAAASMAFAAANKIQIPLTEEKVIDETKGDKLCFYSVQINLGDSNTAKPYQIFAETDEGRYEEARNFHSVTINPQGHLILKVTRSASAKGVACPASKEILLLN